MAIAPPSRLSPKLHRATDQKKVLGESTNKTGTLSSTCVICQNHVHLVQRYFVDGKVYHRNCFRCNECSNTLLSGAYKPGSREGTFICNTHQGPKGGKKAAVTIVGLPTCGIAAETASGLLTTKNSASHIPQPSSVLCTPVGSRSRPVDPSSICGPWTASAAKTQAARQRFFQGAVTTPVPESSISLAMATASPSNGTLWLQGESEKGKARAFLSQRLNTNNNNKSNQAKIGTAQSRSISQAVTKPVAATPHGTTSKEMLCLKAVTKESRRPQSPHFATKGSDLVPPSDWRSNVKHLTHGSEHKSISFTKDCLLDLNPTPVSVPKPAVGSVAMPAVQLTIPTSQGKYSSKQCLQAAEATGLENGKILSPLSSPRPGLESCKSQSWGSPQEDILRELKDIEESLNELEKEGVEMEKCLRKCEEEGKEGELDVLMVDWFALIQKKQFYMRRESELVYIARTQDLEDQQPAVERDLRRLMEKPEHLKTAADVREEQKLLCKLLEIVDDRNSIIQVLDDDRLREMEEDEQLNEMMQQFGECWIMNWWNISSLFSNLKDICFNHSSLCR
uniref:Mical-like 2a n=1 Tax=Scleropages formosus TaxID=113540 RepID=A0A8C9WLN1_SCLFO